MRYLLHVTGPSDRWDLLAWRYYGDANRIAPLIRANRALFIDGIIPALLPPDLTLRVPVLDPEPLASDLLPPWKRSAA
jgi:hypothetical protein